MHCEAAQAVASRAEGALEGVEPAAPTPAAQEHHAPLLQEHELLILLHAPDPRSNNRLIYRAALVLS